MLLFIFVSKGIFNDQIENANIHIVMLLTHLHCVNIGSQGNWNLTSTDCQSLCIYKMSWIFKGGSQGTVSRAKKCPITWRVPRYIINRAVVNGDEQQAPQINRTNIADQLDMETKTIVGIPRKSIQQKLEAVIKIPDQRIHSRQLRHSLHNDKPYSCVALMKMCNPTMHSNINL